MLWDMSISKRLDRYLQHGRVTGARKTQITASVTLAVTLTIEQVPTKHEVAHGATINLDAGKTPCWAQLDGPLKAYFLARSTREVARHVILSRGDHFIRADFSLPIAVSRH